MTHSVIHYWCLPEPGWWIIKPLIRPGNSASISADDTHLHKSHAAIFHTLAHKHKHTPTRSHTHRVHRFWLALRCAWLTLFFFFFFQELFQNTHISVIPGRGTLARAANTEFRTGLNAAHDELQHLGAQRQETICSTSSGPQIISVSYLLDDRDIFAYFIHANARVPMHSWLHMRGGEGETGGMTESETKRGREKQILEFVFTSRL